MRAIFVTGTDTGVGKTTVCECLVSFLRSKGLRPGIQKWVSTGGKEDYSLDAEYSYIFDFASSPHLAAELEEREVEIEKIEQDYHRVLETYEVLLVEGVGGVMVPLKRDYLLIDLVKKLSLPVLVVSRSGLGTINHTLLTIEALRKREIEILGVIFNSLKEENDLIVRDNMKIIAEMSGVRVFGLLPKADREGLLEAFTPIGERVYERLNREGS